jgi:hypothetical protein
MSPLGMKEAANPSRAEKAIAQSYQGVDVTKAAPQLCIETFELYPSMA